MPRPTPKTPALALMIAILSAGLHSRALAQESPYLYGIHDQSPSPQEWLNHLNNAGVTGWVTATVAIGHNPGDTGGDDFRWISNQGHGVICRINNSYSPDGTIPVVSEYGNFATRCANYVANTQGCSLFVIGNETNLSNEWPRVNGWRTYISPQDYANCFRQCYNAIKAVRPSAKVICQALAPFGGPYGPGADHDGNPLTWIEYMNQMLTAINSTGGIDGIALHINSRGYTYNDVHSTQKVLGLYFSFYVYKDWINLGTPASLRTLPYYATECNGIYYWDGGFPECTDINNPSCSYQNDWLEWIYEEINSWNQSRAASGEGIIRCVNMYRWCSHCDGWNIDEAAKKAQILADLDDAAAARYRWDYTFTSDPPTGSNLSLGAAAFQTDSVYGPQWGGDKAIDGIVSAQSKWTSAGSAPPHWLSLDLGNSYTVTGYVVRLPGDAGEPAYYNATGFELQIANSLAGPWSTEATVNNTAQASVIYRSYVTPKQIRYARLYLTGPGIDNYARIPEFEVWGIPGSVPPVADFSGTPRSGFAPLNVQFTDLSSGNPTGWSWSFGDSGTSGSQNPLRQYTSPGTYTVSLTAANAHGNDTETKTGYIVVNATPACCIGDYDCDDDVDLDDFGEFQRCLGTTGLPMSDPGCARMNFNGDERIDAMDYAAFVSCLSGKNIPPPPECCP